MLEKANSIALLILKIIVILYALSGLVSWASPCTYGLKGSIYALIPLLAVTTLVIVSTVTNTQKRMRDDVCDRIEKLENFIDRWVVKYDDD